MLSGMPAIVTVDKNNNCKIVNDNCAPYDVNIDRYDIFALMDRETEQLQPLEDSVISAILTDIDKNYQKFKLELQLLEGSFQFYFQFWLSAAPWVPKRRGEVM